MISKEPWSQVLGHAKMRDVIAGRTTFQDKTGNDQADKLAVAGAESHQDRALLEHISRTSKEEAKRVHRQYLNILVEHAGLTSEIYDCRREEELALQARLHHFARRRPT